MPKERNARKLRLVRHRRLRRKASGTSERLRLCVFRSLNHIYAQVIDDVKGHTIAQASSTEPEIRAAARNTPKAEVSKLVGTAIAKRAVENQASRVVFDRAGYKYHGRVKALAEAAREGGLIF